MVLPYRGRSGESLVKSLTRSINRLTSGQLASKVVYKSTRLGECFNIKDTTKLDHRHDLVYKIECPDNKCKEIYIGETKRRLSVRVNEHSGKDRQSLVAKHTLDSGHGKVSMNNVSVLGRCQSGNSYKRKILESLYIKREKPSLNIQIASVPLCLF